MKLPDGWKQTKLSEIGTFSKGSGIKREESNSGCIPAVRYGEIYTDHDEYIKQFHSFISESVAKEAVLLKKGDLLFSCSGETKEDIGKCVAFVSDVSAYAGGDIIILSPHVECDSQYLGFLLNSYEINKQRYRYAQGDSIVHISSESLGKLQVALPPLPEQQKIARILSAQDKVILLKQKLLQEKQRQKKYLMRKLLSQDGASFTLCGTTIDKCGWKKEKFENIFKKFITQKHSIQSLDYLNKGKIPIIDQGQKFIVGFTNDETAINQCPANGVIVFGDHTRIFKFIKFDFAIGADGTQLLELKIADDIKFFYYSLCNLKLPNDGYGRHFKYLKEFSFFRPALPEQRAIVQVLSAADKEIELLQKSIEQEKQKKKALMQLLLTGTVRVKI